jgi:hypothetical protein
VEHFGLVARRELETQQQQTVDGLVSSQQWHCGRHGQSTLLCMQQSTVISSTGLHKVAVNMPFRTHYMNFAQCSYVYSLPLPAIVSRQQ